MRSSRQAKTLSILGVVGGTMGAMITPPASDVAEARLCEKDYCVETWWGFEYCKDATVASFNCQMEGDQCEDDSC